MLDTNRKQMEQWSVLSNEVKYVQHNQHLIGHYALEVKTLEERYNTKMYKRLQLVKEMDFNPNSERLKLDYVDLFEEVKSIILYTQPIMIRSLTLV